MTRASHPQLALVPENVHYNPQHTSARSIFFGRIPLLAESFNF
jgi:hypothetical protein